MFRVKGLLNKGLVLISVLSILSLISSYIIVDSTHKPYLKNEYKKIKDYHIQTTHRLIDDRLEHLILLAEELYILGNWGDETIKSISPTLDELWGSLEMTFDLSSMVIKQGDKELIYGEIEHSLLNELNAKTMSSFRPQAKFICRPTCYLLASIPIFLKDTKATLLVSSHISLSVASIQSVLQSDLAVLISEEEPKLSKHSFRLGEVSYSLGVNTNQKLTKAAIDEIHKLIKQEPNSQSDASSITYTALLNGIQFSYENTQLLAWLAFVENDSDTISMLFVKNVDNLLLQQQKQQLHILIIVGAISLGILAAISFMSYRPIQRLVKLRHTMTYIGDKKYVQAQDALGNVKDGRISDEIDSLERQFAYSIDQLIGFEEKLLDSQQRLTKMATVDVTTKLFNRNAFVEDMKALEKYLSKYKTTLLFIDLDGFKTVNDNLGHLVGDIVLEQVGLRLKTLVDTGIKIYRIGGDEFLIAIEQLASIDDLEAYCDQVIHIFDSPLYIELQNITVSASIGVAVASEDTNNHVELLKQADIAMYHAKNAGKNQYCFISDKMLEQIQLRYTINNQFLEALAEGQLFLAYQAIVDINTNKLVKLEALSRWVHPELGFIRPDIFIDVIEETTHIDALSEWLITQAAKKVNELDAMGLSDVVVSINISGAQVIDIDSIGILMIACTKERVEYNRIELEITETSLISDFEKARDWITKINKLGFRIAIDDFGTGYSSLSYLTAFPFDCVKLDRSLLIDVEHSERTRNIVGSITKMLHSMKVPVVAEGVETQSHLEVIKQLDCDYVQGYYFSRPLADKDLKTRLDDYTKQLNWTPETDE